jgi:hypothetical protein
MDSLQINSGTFSPVPYSLTKRMRRWRMRVRRCSGGEEIRWAAPPGFELNGEALPLHPWKVENLPQLHVGGVDEITVEDPPGEFADRPHHLKPVLTEMPAVTQTLAAELLESKDGVREKLGVTAEHEYPHLQLGTGPSTALERKGGIKMRGAAGGRTPSWSRTSGRCGKRDTVRRRYSPRSPSWGERTPSSLGAFQNHP